MRTLDTFHAVNRFGLGPTPKDVFSKGDDPRGWVIGQIADHETPTVLRSFTSSEEIIKGLHDARMAGAGELEKMAADNYRKAFAPEVIARSRAMIETDVPFAERMVMFWSNHFTISRSKAIVGPVIPAYEREAIRPHIFGRFSEMLIAVCRHPAMLSYLDNAASFGENSRAGKRRRRRSGTEKTLNENLAREILELHTLGVDGGYEQVDVIELAKVISGWSHGGLRFKFEDQPAHGRFEFKPYFHEPGTKRVLGKKYREDGVNEGTAVLNDLAQHPSTAKFIATKLVRHFVTDRPDPADVERIAKVFLDSEGDLAETARAIVELDAAWEQPLSKVKSHYEFVISVNRAMGNTKPRPRDVFQALREMGQIPFSAPSPAGWGDEANDWVAPESLMRRIEWTHRFCARLPSSLVPAKELERLLGPVASEALALEVQRAPSGTDAMTLILTSPEFQRR
ncbi:MAG: DUF1800 domain-containing protein [Pseudomonadota bacterium]